MRAFLHHLSITLKLNFRNPQAVVLGYGVPIFFLFAYAGFFLPKSLTASTGKQLSTYMGQLLTIPVLGGACFGMPIGVVSERERGVWRRYRLTPVPTIVFVCSTLVARLILVLAAAVLQIALAMWVYKMPWPRDIAQLALAFVFVSFAFLAIGMVIAMVASSVQAVQALGQSLFLPMIMIAGVGRPLTALPEWAQITTAFLPLRYAIQAIDPAVYTVTVRPHLYGPFNYVALAAIGVASTLAAVKLFRWENVQQRRGADWLWAGIAVASWVVMGLLAITYKYV
ncbi:MAG: ABC transporter permease [Phycisphaerae bacterium]